jgi:hypothetical protein
MQQSPPLLVKGTFVGFVPTASHMCVTHLVFTCLTGCPRCDQDFAFLGVTISTIGSALVTCDHLGLVQIPAMRQNCLLRTEKLKEVDSELL